MFKLALSNIWNRRGRYGFLLLELIAVTALGWHVMDRLVVLDYQYNQPVGYDADLLCVIGIAEKPIDWNHDYGEQIKSNRESFMRILSNIRSLPEVDKATPVKGGLMEKGASMQMSMSVEDKWIKFADVTYFPGEDFFTTFGIKGPDGEDISDYLSKLDGYGRIEPVNSVRAANPNGDPYAKNDSILAVHEERMRDMPGRVLDGDRPLLGMTWPVRFSSVSANHVPVFKTPILATEYGNGIVARLNPDIDRDKFVTGLLSRMSDFNDGDLSVSSVRSYADLSEERQNRESGADRRLDKIFTLFFLSNVCLGIIGIFWMMTRKRAPEVGVLRAFGFSSGKIRHLLFSEVGIIAVTAWLIGCMIYLVYALKHGLFMGNIEEDTYIFQTTWVENFPAHFAIISVIILALVLVAVMVGVAGPGWKLSRVNPIDVLRDE